MFGFKKLLTDATFRLTGRKLIWGLGISAASAETVAWENREEFVKLHSQNPKIFIEVLECLQLEDKHLPKAILDVVDPKYNDEWKRWSHRGDK